MSPFRFAKTILFVAAAIVSFQTSIHGQANDEAHDFFTVKASADVEIAAEEAGIIRKLHIKEGAVVKKNDELVGLNHELFELDSKRLQSELKIAKAQSTSKVDLDFAVANEQFYLKTLSRFERAQKLVPKSVSNGEYEQTDLERKRSTLGVEQARLEQTISKERVVTREFEAAIAKKKLQLRTIRSTLDGQVLQIAVEEGEWVQAGQSIARIVNYDKVIASGFVQFGRFRSEDVGKEVQFQMIKPKGDGNPISGKILFVSPELEPNYRDPKVRITVEIENPDHHILINSELVLLPSKE